MERGSGSVPFYPLSLVLFCYVMLGFHLVAIW